MTIHYRLRNPRRIRRRRGEPLMKRKPFRQAMCLSVIHLSPKKPNSAKRASCRIKFLDGKKTRAYIPGEGHTVQEYNMLLIRGGRTKDLPGLKLKVVRGVKDASAVTRRVTSRSKYGHEKIGPMPQRVVYIRELNRAKQMQGSIA